MYGFFRDTVYEVAPCMYLGYKAALYAAVDKIGGNTKHPSHGDSSASQVVDN